MATVKWDRWQLLIKLREILFIRLGKISSLVHKLINYVRSMQELPEQCKEFITVPVYKKADKTDCSNYRDLSLLPTTYKILSNILLSRLTPFAEEVIGDHQCGFWSNRSTADRILCVRQILERKGGIQQSSASAVCRLQKTYDSVKMEVLSNILIQYGIHMKLERLIKMCLNETYSRVRVGKKLSDMLRVESRLKQGDALSPLLFNFPLMYML